MESEGSKESKGNCANVHFCAKIFSKGFGGFFEEYLLKRVCLIFEEYFLKRVCSIWKIFSQKGFVQFSEIFSTFQ